MAKSLFEHNPISSHGAVNDSPQVNIQGLLPIFGCQILRQSKGTDASVVEHIIQTSVFGDRVGNQSIHVRF